MNGVTPVRCAQVWVTAPIARAVAGDASPRTSERRRGVSLSLLYGGFLVYTVSIVTNRLPVADIAMVVALVGLAIQRNRLQLPTFLIWFALFVAWCIPGYAATVYRDQAWDGLVVVSKVWLITLVAANALSSGNRIRYFMITYLGCFFVYPVRGALHNYYVVHHTVFGRAVWNYIYSNPNDLAALALLPLSFAAALLVTERRGWVRIGAWGGIAVLPVLILLTQSRGGILALSVGAAIALWGHLRHVRPLFLTAAAAILMVTVTPASVWERMAGLSKAIDAQSLREADPEGSAEARYGIWQVAVRIIQDHPLVGIGVGTYRPVHADYAPATDQPSRGALGGRDTHSTYLNVLAETGYPGLVLFLAVVLSTAYRAERARKRCKQTLPASSQRLLYLELGLLGFCVAGLFGSFARLAFLYLDLALLWATAEASERDLRAVHGLAVPARYR